MRINQYLILLLFLITTEISTAAGEISCAGIFSVQPQNKAPLDPGYNFVHQKYPQLYKSKPVELTAKQASRVSGKALKQPADKIKSWLNYLENIYVKHRENPVALQKIKEHYYDLYLTKKNEIPESYYELQLRIARQRGYGDLILTKETRNELAETAIGEQKESLDRWLGYFFSDESRFYPMWTKYWVFTSMVKLGKYNPETASFGSRSHGQVSPFADLNPEALAIVIDLVVKHVNGKSLSDIQDPELLNLMTQPAQLSFSKLYAQALKTSQQKVKAHSTDGKWVHYKKGSDHMPLVNSLLGMNTGWCTAGESTAQEQLARGDFHVYYSKDETGEANIPRIAIRMEGSKIAEVRGSGEAQNLDSAIAKTSVLESKLQEFGAEGQIYLKSDSDMRKLAEIEQKNKQSETLNKVELRFLYEIDAPISSFRHGDYFGDVAADPRIKEIISSRDIRKDISQALNIKPEQVSLTVEEAIKGNIECHYGFLRVAGTEELAYSWSTQVVPPGTVLPKIVLGKFSFQGFSKDMKITLPRRVKEDFNLSGPKSAAGIKFPEYVGKDFYLTTIDSKDGLVEPKFIGGQTNYHKIDE